jgi:hypothetical protein
LLKWLEANPHARADGYKPTAPTTPALADPDPLTGRDLAELAALASDPHSDPNMRTVVWEARVAKAAREMQAQGATAPAPGGLSVAAGVQVNEADRKTLSDLAAAVSPLTGRRYVDDLGAEGQRAREALFYARAAVLAGQPLDAELLKQVRAGIARDQAEADRRKAAKDAEDLKTLRERQQ